MEIAGPARAPLAEALEGRVLSERYRIDGCIGAGQTSVVFRGSDLRAQRPVAVKVLAAEPDDALRLGERLEREARIAASIRHPGIVEIYGHGVTREGLHFIAMELLGGETLAQKLARERRLAADEVVRIGAGIASALAVLHALGYVHRDLKPSNVFLVPHAAGGRDVKLVDFGAASPVSLAGIHADQVAKKTLLGIGERAISTLPGVVFGAPQYISPEQASGVEVDGRADVYSLGALVYEMLTGATPYPDDTPLRQIARHIAGAPARPRQRAPEARVPRSIERVVMRALERRREDRFASAAEMSSALWWALAESRDERVSDAALGQVAVPRGPTAGPVVLAVAAVAIVAVVAGAVIRSGTSATTAPSAVARPATPEPSEVTPRREPAGPEVVPVDSATPPSVAASEPAPRDTAPDRHPKPLAQPPTRAAPATAVTPAVDLKDPYR